MKFLVAGVGCVVVSVAVFLAWFYQGPTTQLVDAHGKDLVAGETAAEEEGLFGGALFAEARSLIEVRNFAAAKAALLGILEDSDRDGETCILLCDVTLERDEVEEAVDYGLKAIELLPEEPAAHLSYAKALGSLAAKQAKGFSGMLGAMKTAKRFAAEAERVVELDPADTEARTMLLLYNLAPLVGDRERARELALELEERDPILGRQMRAYVTYKDGDLDRALELCREGLAEHPEGLGLHNTMAGILGEEERFAEADAEFEAARTGEKDVDYWYSLYYQARMHTEHELEPEVAIALLEEYLAEEPVGERLPKPASAYHRQGLALEQAGRIDEARAAYQECLRRDPLSDRAREALDGLTE